MKIAILSPFYPYRGGIAQFSGLLYNALEKEHSVRAYTFRKMYPDFLFPGKSQYLKYDDPALIITTYQLLNSIDPRTFKKTAKDIENYAPNILIISYWMPFFVPAYRAIAKRLKKKMQIVGLIHNAIPHEPRFFDNTLTKHFFKHCHRFIALSETVKDDILKISPNADIILQPHPIYEHYGAKIDKNEALASLNLDPKKKTLLFFGLIREYKGLDLLIEAMDRLDDSYQLIIAGESYVSFNNYKEQIKRTSAADRIKTHIYFVNNEQLTRFFSAADLLVLPYKSATQSGVVPVAYHFELPILATDVGELKKTIDTPKTGLICQVDAESIAKGIQEYFNSPREPFIENIKEEKKRLGWDSFAEAVIK